MGRKRRGVRASGRERGQSVSTPVSAVSGRHHRTHTLAPVSVSAPRSKVMRVLVRQLLSPEDDAKSMQTADSCRGGQEAAGHHCAQSPAVSAPPPCGVMLRKSVARKRENAGLY